MSECKHLVSLDSMPPICGECGEVDPWSKPMKLERSEVHVQPDPEWQWRGPVKDLATMTDEERIKASVDGTWARLVECEKIVAELVKLPPLNTTCPHEVHEADAFAELQERARKAVGG